MQTPSTAAPLDPSFVEWAIKQFKKCAEAEEPQRQNQLSDYEFSAPGGHQWSQADKDLRGNRPMLENNRLNNYVLQQVNQTQQARMSPNFNPADDEADPDTAEILQGLYRLDESNSDGEMAFLIAAGWQVRAGVGYCRVVPEYDDDDSGNQHLEIQAVPNRMTIYDDPASTHPAGKDRNILFATEWLEEDEYLRRFPNSQVATILNSGQGLGDVPPQWFKKGSILIAEVFRRETKPERITLKNGKTRVKERAIVTWAKINGLEVLEGEEDEQGKVTGPRRLPIPYIPFARAIGEVFYLDGKVDYVGITRIARDPQKYANYTFSSAAEAIAVGNKVPYKGYRPVIENHPEWHDANVKNYSILLGEAVTGPNGQLLPLPERSSTGIEIQHWAVMGQWAENNLRAVIGYIDVQEQETRHEQSGRAIHERKTQAEQGNSHYGYHLGKMVQHIGRIWLAWAPHIYDAPRIKRILGKDDEARTVMIHAGMPPPELAQGPNGQPPMSPQQLAEQRGIDGIYDLKQGRYDVTVSVGQSYPTRRAEANEGLSALMSAAPELMIPLAADLFFENMDTPVSRKLAQRAKKQFKHEDEDQQDQQIPPQVQQQMQMLMQQHEALSKELEAKTAYIEREQAKLDGQLEIKKAEFEMQIKLQEIKNAAAIRVKEIDAEIKGVLLRHEAEHEAQALGVAEAHEAEQAERSRAHEVAMASAQQRATAQQTAQQMDYDERMAGADREAQMQMQAMQRQPEA